MSSNIIYSYIQEEIPFEIYEEDCPYCKRYMRQLICAIADPGRITYKYCPYCGKNLEKIKERG